MENLKKGIKIEFESGLKYQILKVYDGNMCDIKALQPQFEWMPDFYPVYYSIKLESYKILSNKLESVCPVCWEKLEDGIVKGMCLNDNCLTNHGRSEF